MADHDHDAPGHSHAIGADADTRWLTLALIVNASFMLVEVVVGIAASSLALLTDAGHMLTDVAAIGLALFAARLARRAPRGSMTFGYQRAEILSAMANGLTLLLLGAYFAYEGIALLFDPPTVEAGLVLWVGVAGLGANLLAAWFLAKASRQSLNVQGAVAHNLIDALGSVGAAVAAIVVLLTGFDRADPIASLLITAIMLRSGWGLVRDSGRIFLEASPKGLDPEAIGNAMASMQGVAEVHDLHVWEVTSGFPALAAHVLVKPGHDCHGVRRDLERLLHGEFHIDHTTLQVDHEGTDLVQLGMTAPQPAAEP